MVKLWFRWGGLLGLVALTGCAACPVSWYSTLPSPLQAYGREPDPVLAFRLLQAANCAYAVKGKELDTKSTDYPSCLPKDLETTYPFEDANGVDAYVLLRTKAAVILAYRGTLPFDGAEPRKVALKDWLQDAKIFSKKELDSTDSELHQGFVTAFHQTSESLWDKLQEWKAQGALANKKFYVTGHSKGGAVAVIAAFELQTQGTPDGTHIVPDAVYTFAAPRAGDAAFAGDYQKAGIDTWRYENYFDVVPHLPPNSQDLPALDKFVGQLSGGKPHEFQSVGNLVYLDPEGVLRGDSTVLDQERREILRRAFRTLLIDQIAHEVVQAHLLREDHRYYQVVCKAAGETQCPPPRPSP